jgi:hypothetical protein
MNRRVKIENYIFLNGLVFSLCIVAIFLVLNLPAVAQTAGETISTMGIQQELIAGEARQRIAEPNLDMEVDEDKEAASETTPANTPKVKGDNVEKEQPHPALTENADANAAGPDINDFNDYKQEIIRIDFEARDEESKWLGRTEKKSDLAKAMNDVVVAELKFLRKLAEEDGSQKIVEAIDLLLKKRQDRLVKLTTKLEDEVRTERRERRQPRMGGAGAGEQGQSERRPQRRTRAPIQPANTNINGESQQP